MGFFDFLKGKEEVPEQPQDIGSVELRNVKGTIEKSISEQLAKEREKSKELYSKIKEKFREVKKLNNELSGKTFKSGQRMDAPVNMIKDNYVKKTLSSLNNVPGVDDFGYSEITDFCSETEKVLKNLRNIPPKQAVLLSKYFKGETSKIVKILKEIEDMKKEMKSVLDGKALWIGGEVNSNIDSIFEMQRRTEDLKKQENTLLEKIKDKEKEVLEREKELKEFASSKELKDFESLGSEIKDLENEKSKIENEIREELSGVKRPLKKLEYSLKQEGGKDSLLKVSHSPMKSLFLEQGDSLLREALVKLRELRLKDNEKERVEELITKIENGYISKLRDRYMWLEKEIREKKGKEESSNVLDKKLSRERETENLKKQILEFEREREKIENNRKETSKSIEKGRKELEDMIRKEINVNLNIIV
jgi:hypothetical protein